MDFGYLTTVPGTQTIQREIHDLRQSLRELMELKKFLPTTQEVERLILFKKTRLYFLRRVMNMAPA